MTKKVSPTPGGQGGRAPGRGRGPYQGRGTRQTRSTVTTKMPTTLSHSRSTKLRSYSMARSRLGPRGDLDETTCCRFNRMRPQLRLSHRLHKRGSVWCAWTRTRLPHCCHARTRCVSAVQMPCSCPPNLLTRRARSVGKCGPLMVGQKLSACLWAAQLHLPWRLQL